MPRELCAAIVIATEASALPNSIIAVVNAVISSPDPPYFSGTITPIRPNSPISVTSSFGNISFESNSRATGVILVMAKSLTISFIILCSSLKNRLFINNHFHIGRQFTNEVMIVIII